VHLFLFVSCPYYDIIHDFHISKINNSIIFFFSFFMDNPFKEMAGSDPMICLLSTLLNGVQKATKHQTADHRNHTQRWVL
jgi:hypothetical protein